MKTTTILQREYFKTSPKEFYKAFMDSLVHGNITGSEAVIEDKEGGKFSAHGGYCFGENVELRKGKKIVQTWCAPDEHWPEDHFSKITLELHEDIEGTRLEFMHEEVPDKASDAIAQGWIDHYWIPFKTYFGE